MITLSRIGVMTFLVVGAILLVVSSSRGPLVATVGALSLFGVSRLSKRGGVSFLLFFLAFLFLAYIIADYAESNLGLSPLSRLRDIASLSADRSIALRLTAFSGAWNQFLDSPILGSGLEERITGFYPHNVILESFMATGILGGTAFTAVVVSAALFSWRLMRSGSRQSWVGLLYLQAFIGALLSGSISESTILWCLVGAVIAARSSSQSHLASVAAKETHRKTRIPIAI